MNSTPPLRLPDAARAIIARRWPSLLTWLEAPLTREINIDNRHPQATLVIDGLHLSSCHDQDTEAELQAAEVPRNSLLAWQYGLATPLLPMQLLQHPALQKLNVVLLCPQVTNLVLQAYDANTAWLSDPRLELIDGRTEQKVHAPFTAVAACLELADDACAKLRDRVHLALSMPFIHSRHNGNDAAMVARMQEMLPVFSLDPDIAELKNRHAGETLIVAGAGPTLTQHARLLADHPEWPVIATDAATRTLVKVLGRQPDYLVTVDGHPATTPFMQDADPAQTLMVYAPTARPGNIAAWAGRRYGFLMDAPLVQKMFGHLSHARLFSSGSVIHPAIDLACHLGARHIVLIGADFGFPDRKSHADACPVQVNMPDSGHWVFDGHGNKLSTTPNLRGYLLDLEEWIARHPDIGIHNASQDGARIAGTHEGTP